MKARRLICIVLALTALSIVNCTDNDCTTNCPLCDSVDIQGTVSARVCGIEYHVNLYTAEPATVSFIRDNGFVTRVQTDESSNFALTLSAGSHRIVVETDCTRVPDTFYNVLLVPGDTTLPLDIGLDLLDPLNMRFEFVYQALADTIGTASEWVLVNELNQRTIGQWLYNYPVLVMPDLDSFAEQKMVWLGGAIVHYDLPINQVSEAYKDSLTVFKADDLIENLLDQDTTGVFPGNFSVFPSGRYACLR